MIPTKPRDCGYETDDLESSHSLSSVNSTEPRDSGPEICDLQKSYPQPSCFSTIQRGSGHEIYDLQKSHTQSSWFSTNQRDCGSMGASAAQDFGAVVTQSSLITTKLRDRGGNDGHDKQTRGVSTGTARKSASLTATATEAERQSSSVTGRPTAAATAAEGPPGDAITVGDSDFADDLELNSFEPSGKDAQAYEQFYITVDSGAAQAVAKPSDFPGSTITDSIGSLSGQVYVGPGGEQIPNEGQFHVRMRLDDGKHATTLFQAAQVKKPLLAVSSCNDKGNLVLFDGNESFIFPSTRKDLIQKLRAIVKDVPDKIRLHRKNGVYHMKAWRSKAGFTRQGV